MMGIVLCLHLLLACGFMLYFFHVPPTSGTGPSNATEVVVTKVQQQEGESVKEQKTIEEEETPVKESTSEKRSVSQGGGKGGPEGADQQVGVDGGGGGAHLDKVEEGNQEKNVQLAGGTSKKTDENVNGEISEATDSS